VKLAYWDGLLMADGTKIENLKYCPKLTKAHVHPDPFQKQNCKMAWQVGNTFVKIF